MTIRRTQPPSSIGEKLVANAPINVLDAATVAKLEASPYNGPRPGAPASWVRIDKSGITIHTADKDAGGSPFVTRDGAMQIKRFDAEQRSAEFVASTDAIDAHGDVIDQASWILNDYQSNPIVLYGHNSRDLPIGKATSVGVVSGKLMATIKFATAEANPMAEQVWKLINEGILKAVSVGFQPTDGRYEMRDGDEVFVWRSPILKEISVVPVPANPEALARMKSAFHAKHQPDPQLTPPAAPDPTHKAAPPRKEGPAMDPKELQDKIEKQAATLALAEANVQKEVARAEKAEAQLVDVASKLKALETEKTAFEAQVKTLAGERDAEKARADKLDDELTNAHVEALVGVKIAPPEKETFVELRKTNKALFEKMIAQRQPMRLTEKVIKEAPPTGGGAADDLLAEFKA